MKHVGHRGQVLCGIPIRAGTEVTNAEAVIRGIVTARTVPGTTYSFCIHCVAIAALTVLAESENAG